MTDNTDEKRARVIKENSTFWAERENQRKRRWLYFWQHEFGVLLGISFFSWVFVHDDTSDYTLFTYILGWLGYLALLLIGYSVRSQND